jgi:uncharacterized membrane protein YbhN (UPF0104 family)
VRWILAAGVLLAVGWFFATRIDGSALVRAVAGADYRLVLLCAVGHMALLHPLKAWRWARMSPHLAGAALVLLFVNLTNAIPVTPGQVGLFEAGATAASLAIGASAEQGFALGVLYHLMQVIPETAWGAVVLARASLGRRELAAEGHVR